jgi:Zn-dependent protease
MFTTPTPEELLVDVIVLVVMLGVAFPIHEFSHALAAYRLGDSTARFLGRLTLDPRAHFDPQGGLILIISMLAGFPIGWAKPTPYNPYNLRGGRWGEAIVSVAGPISNLVLATAAALPFRYVLLSGMDVPLLAGILDLFITINLYLMVFNLIPIPPLDGSKVLYAFLDPQTERQVRPFLEQYGMLLLLLLIFLPFIGGPSIIGSVFGAIVDPIHFILTGR